MLTRQSWAAASVAPPGSYTRGALRLLGLDVERVELAAATHLRAAVATALAGVRTRPTKMHPDGVNRGALIRSCGKRHAFKIGETFDMQPVCCRQRSCPSCARARARDNAGDVERAMDARRSSSSCTFVFATLTHVKRPRFEESPREAVHRIVKAWQEITNSRTAIGREFRRLFAGGLRTNEVTYAHKGDKHRNGPGVVAFSGYHAHLHVLLEVREGVRRGDACAWLQREWLAHNEGASPGAQRVLAASVKHAHELCKYVTKPLEESARRPAILRELFAAIHGVRMLQPFGEWTARASANRLGWRELGDDDETSNDSAPRWRGPEIGDLLKAATNEVEGTTDRVAFLGYAPGDEIYVSAAEAWLVIGRVVADRTRDGGRTNAPQRAHGPPSARGRPPPS